MSAPATFASAYRQLRSSEKAFVDGYVADVEREASRAGERISNALYRAIPAHVVEASRGMLEKPLVLAAITERVLDVERDKALSVDRVVREIMSVAFANMEDFAVVTDVQSPNEGDLPLGVPHLDMTGLSREQWAAVESFEVEMDPRNPFIVRKRKIKLHSKLEAIKMLAQYTGMFNDDNPHYRASQARPLDAMALPASVTVDQAGDAYSAYLNGG